MLPDDALRESVTMKRFFGVFPFAFHVQGMAKSTTLTSTSTVLKPTFSKLRVATAMSITLVAMPLAEFLR
jgi:hypothetical protein